jgi:hypothetical protein
MFLLPLDVCCSGRWEANSSEEPPPFLDLDPDLFAAVLSWLRMYGLRGGQQRLLEPAVSEGRKEQFMVGGAVQWRHSSVCHQFACRCSRAAPVCVMVCTSLACPPGEGLCYWVDPQAGCTEMRALQLEPPQQTKIFALLAPGIAQYALHVGLVPQTCLLAVPHPCIHVICTSLAGAPGLPAAPQAHPRHLA